MRFERGTHNATEELYDPKSASFKDTGSLVMARLVAQATLLNSGEV